MLIDNLDIRNKIMLFLVKLMEKMFMELNIFGCLSKVIRTRCSQIGLLINNLEFKNKIALFLLKLIENFISNILRSQIHISMPSQIWVNKCIVQAMWRNRKSMWGYKKSICRSQQILGCVKYITLVKLRSVRNCSLWTQVVTSADHPLVYNFHGLNSILPWPQRLAGYVEIFFNLFGSHFL